MANQLVTNGLYACRIWTVQAEQAAVNTIYYNVLNQTGTAVNDTDLAAQVEAAVATIYKSIQSTDVNFRGVQVFLTNPIAGMPAPAPVFSNASAGPGTLTPPDCPRQVSGLIQWTTNFSGRRYRGHFYMPFPSTSLVATDGVPTAAYQTVLVNLANALLGLTSIHNVGFTGTATVAMYLHHRPGKSPTPLATPITGKVVPPKFATQRRRGSYGRANSSPI
jgi:hypothetical protein